MKENQVKLVQESFSKVVPIAEQAAELFYGKLFEIAPQVKPMFKSTDMKEQGKKLMQTIGLAVNGLSNLESIVPVVQQLGVKHIDYGVKDEHFPIVAEALLWTLEQGLGDAWNEEVKGAWVEAYTVLANTMIDAMNEARAAQEAPKGGFFTKLKGMFA
ncbi:hemin receptor [Saccharobesus litoralis]|uniref:Hemin receptor n=1 Tax=Saccharobesus litoralis TaxID=2172099 RepID=A0A2S0VMR3_9ALTE|nr:globin family protein [Saccharobesus litoralis]AWB65513.1 hemin receptor [Saccharobesus litoralis]